MPCSASVCICQLSIHGFTGHRGTAHRARLNTLRYPGTPTQHPCLQQGYDLIFIGAAQVVLPVLLHCLQDLVQEISLHAWGLGHAQPLPMNSFSDLSLCHRSREVRMMRAELLCDESMQSAPLEISRTISGLSTLIRAIGAATAAIRSKRQDDFT